MDVRSAAAWFLAALSAAPGVALAESARVASFAGHRAIEDPTDVFMFPGLLFAHADRLHVDFVPSAAEGQAGVNFGSDPIVGVHVGRALLQHHPRSLVSPTARPLDDYDVYSAAIQGVGVAVPPRPGLMADLLFGLPTGLGARLTVANAIQDVITTPAPPAGGAAPVADPSICGADETGTEFRTIELGAGWSQRTRERATDIGGALSLNTVKTVNRGCLAAEGAGTPSLSAAARVAFHLAERYDLVALAAMDVRDYDLEFSQLPGKTEASLMGVTVSLGPRMRLSDTVTGAASVVAGLGLGSGRDQRGEGAAATSAEASTTAYVLPGIDLSLEADWKEWLKARAGVLSRYRIVKVEAERADRSKTEVVSTAAEHVAAAGVGIHWDEFEVDGAFNVPFLTSGPDFLGGQAPGVFAELSVSYRWGGAGAAGPSSDAPTYSPIAPPPPAYVPSPAEPPPPVYDDPNDPYWGPR